MRPILALAIFTLSSFGSSFAQSRAASDYLADNTILIIRHAEKPVEGSGLTPQGEARAHLYATYFAPFREDGLTIPVDGLYAGSDSKSSIRPRLTLEPLSKATGLPLHLDVSSKDPAAMVQLLRTQSHGKYPLIAWRHGEIPALLTAFGASPEQLLPNGQWPSDTFDWVVVLTMNHAGQLSSAKVVHETLQVPVPVQ